MSVKKQNACSDSEEAYKQVIASNALAISRFGGRLAVLYKFTTAALSQLDTTRRIEVARRLRAGVGDAISLTEDIALPDEYHEALLAQTNILLTALEAPSAMPR